MITPAFNLTATERVLPSMALDFTTASLDSRVTFTRTGNTATVTNSSGYVVPINANLPRFDYNPITLACKGLLIEESRTNILLKSQDFSDVTNWVPTNIAVTNGQILSPDNLTNGAKFENTIANFGWVEQFVTTGAGTYSASVYAKAGTNSVVQLYFIDAGIVAASNFNLTTGTVTSGTGTIVAVGNGWYKCSIVGTLLAGLNRLRIVNFSTTLGLNLYLWAAQWELGSFDTSYIPTTTSQVTRTADTATMTGTNFSSWYNASEGAVCCEFQLSNIAANNRIAFDLNDNGTNNRFAYRSITTSGNDQLVVRSGGVTYATITSATSASASITKISSCYKINNFGLSKNAADALLDTAGDVPVGNSQIIIGSGFGGAEFLNGYLRKLNYYKQRLINAELAAFSK